MDSTELRRRGSLGARTPDINGSKTFDNQLMQSDTEEFHSSIEMRIMR